MIHYHSANRTPMLLQKIQAGVATLVAVNRLIATVLFAMLTGVVALQVFSRFVIHAPMIWSEEVARFLFFWVVLLGAAMSVKDRRHFVIDVIGNRSSGRPALRLLDILPDVCVLGFSLLLLAEGLGYAQVGVFRTASNSRVNMALVYSAIPTFAALSVIYAAANLLADWTAFRQGRGPAPQPPPAAD
jgi:TRAP-type C4-dicarboxylate transport system permease small subunit